MAFRFITAQDESESRQLDLQQKISDALSGYDEAYVEPELQGTQQMSMGQNLGLALADALQMYGRGLNRNVLPGQHVSREMGRREREGARSDARAESQSQRQTALNVAKLNSEMQNLNAQQAMEASRGHAIAQREQARFLQNESLAATKRMEDARMKLERDKFAWAQDEAGRTKVAADLKAHDTAVNAAMADLYDKATDPENPASSSEIQRMWIKHKMLHGIHGEAEIAADAVFDKKIGPFLKQKVVEEEKQKGAFGTGLTQTGESVPVNYGSEERNFLEVAADRYFPDLRGAVTPFLESFAHPDYGGGPEPQQPANAMATNTVSFPPDRPAESVAPQQQRVVNPEAAFDVATRPQQMMPQAPIEQRHQMSTTEMPMAIVAELGVEVPEETAMQAWSEAQPEAQQTGNPIAAFVRRLFQLGAINDSPEIRAKYRALIEYTPQPSRSNVSDQLGAVKGALGSFADKLKPADLPTERERLDNLREYMRLIEEQD